MVTNIFTRRTKAQAAQVNQNFSECFCNRGTYDSAATYGPNDIVKYNGARYIALVSNLIGVTPGTDATKWEVF